MSPALLCSRLKRRCRDGSRWLSGTQRWSLHLAKLQPPAACVCVCQSWSLITRIVPLVSAMTVIVIAAAFGCRANRSVMSSGCDRLVRDGFRAPSIRVNDTLKDTNMSPHFLSKDGDGGDTTCPERDIKGHTLWRQRQMCNVNISMNTIVSVVLLSLFRLTIIWFYQLC